MDNIREALEFLLGVLIAVSAFTVSTLILLGIFYLAGWVDHPEAGTVLGYLAIPFFVILLMLGNWIESLVKDWQWRRNNGR
jgi:hypothetical protein